jgi:S-formylglutathione hydrolase FrmB
MLRETDKRPRSASEVRIPARLRRAAGLVAISLAGAVAVAGGASASRPAGAAPAGAAPAVPGQAAAAAPGDIPHGTTATIQLPSGDADGKERSVWIYRPAVPDSSDLPVVYFLHGYPGSQDDLAQAGIPALLDAAFAGGAAPFVVVAPNGRSDLHPDTEWADSTDGKVMLETFIVETVIPAVEGDHPRDRAHRAIAGHSMGGYGAMNLGLRHPDLFGQIVSIAGYYHVDDPDLMGGDTPAWIEDHSPDRHVAAGAHSRILLIADADEHDPLIVGEALRYQALARAEGQTPAYVLAPGGHNWAMVAGQIPTIVTFLDAGW